MTTHELKIMPGWFEDVKSGAKNFEIRRNDRDFNVGDELLLKEWNRGKYTGREIRKAIKYIYFGNGTYGLSDEFCILGLRECTEDAISREAALYYIESHIQEIITESGLDKNEHTNRVLRAVVNGIATMPSIYPARPSGRWIEDTRYGIYVTCSKCMKYSWTKDYVRNRDFNFCPNCGTKMEGGKKWMLKN